MDTYDLSHKLSYTGMRCTVLFSTGPQFINSVPGVPVLSEVRIFIDQTDWTIANLFTISREICRVLGATSQFDIGMTMAGVAQYTAARAAAGNLARMTKMDPEGRRVLLRVSDGDGDQVFEARYPRLTFQETGDDFWQAQYSSGAVKPTSQQ
ncbi:MAG: hypothetical protein NVSMB52_16790 [Chloroflexota bacterium]